MPTIGLFAGPGAQISIGNNPNGSGFMHFQFGFGIGGGASWNPQGTSPGHDACQCASWTGAYGLYSEASAQFGISKAALELNVGRTINACENRQYQGIKSKLSVKDGIALKASVSGGGQFSLSGGGKASGDCTCGR